MERLDIEEWPLAPSLGSGHSQMIPKYEESNSQTDCSWYELGKDTFQNITLRKVFYLRPTVGGVDKR